MNQEKIRKQFDYDQVAEIHDVLYNIYNNKSITENKLLRFSKYHPNRALNEKSNVISKLLRTKKDSIIVSKNTAELGLMLLNCFPSYREYERWGYSDTVFLGSKRLNALQSKYDLDNLWNGEHYNLLLLSFGESFAKTIKDAYNNVGSLMYQQGYNRRSFRRPNNTDVTQMLKVNFIISMLNSETVHPFSLAEIIKYDCAEYYSKVHLLVASAINNDTTEIYDLCTDILQGKAEIGDVSRLIIKSLLLSNKPEAWQKVGDLLLSAQRQEGLRQTILESLDETSTGAFLHILKLVNEHNLSRFSSVVRSMDVWAGFGWDAEKQSTIKRFFQLAETYVEQPNLLEKTINSKDNAEIYMAFWGQGVYDIDVCYPYLKKLYQKGTLEKKVLTLYFINQVNISEWTKEFAYLALAEEKPEFNYWAIHFFNKSKNLQNREELYLKAEDIFNNFPKKNIEFKSRVFAWSHFTFTKEQVSKLLVNLTDTENNEELERLLNHYDDFPIEIREKIARIILHNFDRWTPDPELKKPTKKQRDFAFNVLNDRSSLIRDRAIKALKNTEINDEELLIFEDLLTRKSSEFRQFALELIKDRNDDTILLSAKRLIKKSNVEQRLAGLDILNALRKKKVHLTEVTSLANEFSERLRIGKKEQVLLDNLLQQEVVEYNAQNGYGLYNPLDNTKDESIKTPKQGEFIEVLSSKYPLGLSMPIKVLEGKLQELRDVFAANKDYEYEVTFYDGTKNKFLLGNSFTRIYYIDEDEESTPEEVFKSYPLYEKWDEWFKSSGITSYDLFLICFVNESHYHLDEAVRKKLQIALPTTFKKLEKLLPSINIPQLNKEHPSFYYNPVFQVLKVLEAYHQYNAKKEFFVNAFQYIISVVPVDEMSKVKADKNQWGHITQYSILNFKNFSTLYYTPRKYVSGFSDKEFMVYWKSAYHFYRNCASQDKEEARPELKLYVRAYSLNLITEAELIQRIMRPDAIELLTDVYKHPKHWRSKEQKEILDNYPFVKDLIGKCTHRILEIELRRGDSATSVTRLASAIKKVEGVDYLIKILNGLGKDTLNRGYVYGEKSSKKEVLSALLKCCQPVKEDTQENFNIKIKEANFTEKRLIEVSLYAQQWLPFIENYLQWEGLSSAVWWLHAHTNSYHNSETETEFARYSKIDINDFKDGAVDVDWFQEVYRQIGKARWKILYDAAKYISDGTGHARAKLYADVMTGEVKIREVTKRVKEKRNQDYLRVYGLVPLSKKIPEKDVLSRYNYLLQFKKESRQFGSQRQASEKLAVKIAMENLARTAGYPDPIRLTWAMETEEAKNILQKSETLVFEDVTISLQVDSLGKAHIEVERNSKKLKSIPAKLKKEKSIIELKEFHKRLKNQYSRSRKSLEEAMVRGDVFQAKEIQTLTEHPVIAPMLQSLVLISENGLGFYKEGKLINPNKKAHELGESIRVAHCTDIYESKDWAIYQRYCFDNKIVQPFKQIFRELYVPTPDELQEKTISRRYAGHQVQPKKTVALLKTRAWTVDYEEGLQKVFHNEGMIAKMYAMADWFSPADVESPTLETIEFLDRKTYKRIPFDKVNPLLFSEVMRDIDLVVSVAHVGGVDPEASQSTVEMRSIIIQETVRLFKLKTVTLKGHHALIKGERGDYNVHLGSGVTHFNGKYISILPVHSQHRGHLFLPFVDEDPRSAEIMSKILLLAKDKDIKDPTILEQLK